MISVSLSAFCPREHYVSLHRSKTLVNLIAYLIGKILNNVKIMTILVISKLGKVLERGTRQLKSRIGRIISSPSVVS